MLTCLFPVLFTFYIQDVLKLKKIIPAPRANTDSWEIQLTALGVIFTWMRFIFIENLSAGSRHEESGHTGFMEI